MRKIFLLLFAMILSLAATAQLNPYAYGLSSNWNETTQTLTVDFKLNAKANKIEIFAVDRNNSNKTYKIHEITSPGNTLDYSIPIHINGKDKDGNCLPVGKNLTFAVEVDGDARNEPGTPVYTGNRPYSPHGVAVNNCQDSQDFGAVYVTECTNGVSGNTWGWLSGKGRSLLEYNPRLTHKPEGFFKKYNEAGTVLQEFSLRNGYDLLEPHRVRVSDDGRIFVSSYNHNGTSTGKVSVWEFDRATKRYIPVIEHNGAYGTRVCGMDVKGSKENLKILLCYFSENYNHNASFKYGFAVYEYTLSNSGMVKTGDKKFVYHPSDNGTTGANGKGGQSTLAYCASKETNQQNENYNNSKGYFYSDGFVNVAYGKTKPDNDIFFAFDYYYGVDFNARMVYYRDCNAVQYHTINQHGHYYGGGSVLSYKNGGQEYIVSGRAQNHGWGSESPNTDDQGRIQVYPFDRNSTNGIYVSNESLPTHTIETSTKAIINDMAIDCANNLYAVSFNSGQSNTPGTGTLLAVPMPYSGTVTTYCPTSNTDDKEYFQLPARTNLQESITSTNLQTIIENNKGGCGCDISLNRPMQADMFNTICLPFNLNLGTLSDGHPLKGAELKAFTGATLSDTDSGEKILTLNFEDVNSNTLTAYTPYLIEPKADISGAINIDNITFVSSNELEIEKSIQGMDNNNKIYFKGIVPSQTVTPKEVDGKSLTMMLVSDNRLAMMTEEGTMPGFRGYFEFENTPPQGMQARISTSKNTTTGTEVVIDGQKVNIEKFLRDGRIYIRMGESLYSIDGVKVE